MFKIDLYKLIVWMLPEWLRHNVILLLIKSSVYPVVLQYNRFVQFRVEKVYRLQHNSQVCYFQKVLNDRFDSLLRRIRISDFNGLTRLFFWSDTDQRDIFFGNQHFWPDEAYLDSGIDFTVEISADCATTISEYQHLIALINEYRLAGKNYNIQRL